jgi:hypothetical protein
MEAGPPEPTPLFWPAIEASGDLRRPDRDRPEPSPRSLRENLLLYRVHFTPAANTSAIGLLDLTILHRACSTMGVFAGSARRTPKAIPTSQALASQQYTLSC